MLAQCWVTLGVSIVCANGIKRVLPIISRLVPTTGNRNKLTIALALVRGLAPVSAHPLRVLMDSWFMRGRLVLPLLSRKIQVIGQARRDTALFLPPVRKETKGRGRPAKYGTRLTPDVIAALPTTELTLTLYGKEQLLRVKSVVAMARFLKGVLVRAVWCEFFDEDNKGWSRPRLVLATESELDADVIIRIYARRWGIEPLFHNLKRWWGITNLWQQSRTVLELWMQIRSIAWTLVELLGFVVDKSFPIMAVAPWRRGQVLTGGLVAQWLRMEFTGLAFRDGFDAKSGKFTFPDTRKDPRMQI